MKKNILLVLIIFAMLLVIAALVINGLGLLDPAPAEATPAPDTAVTPVPQETAAAEPTPTFTALDDGSIKAIQNDAVTAMSSCADAYAAADKGEAQNVVLSDEAVASMVSALGAAGYSAVDYYGNCNMQNPEALAAFGEAVSAGNDAQAGYFVVHPDGLVHEEVLIYRSGAASVEKYLMKGKLWACADEHGPVCEALMMPTAARSAGAISRPSAIRRTICSRRAGIPAIGASWISTACTQNFTVCITARSR